VVLEKKEKQSSLYKKEVKKISQQYTMKLDFQYLEFSKENDFPQLRKKILKFLREERIDPLEIKFTKRET
jgi:hypothetical protein